MSARRGEVPFVAVPVGQGHDVKEVLGLARDLKIPRAQALGYWVLWKELVLQRGDASRGVVKDLSAVHLAEHVGHRGDPRRLVEAFKRAGFFRTHRGTFVDVGWASSITGAYAIRKAEDRETWARQKKAQREAAAAAAVQSQGADVSPMSTWTSGGHPPPVQVENAQKERKESSGQPPPAPSQSEGELASQRWEWIKENAERPGDPRTCMRAAAAIPADEWPRAQWVLLGCPGGALRSSSRKKRVLDRTAAQILTKRDDLQFRREWQEKLRADARPKNGHAPPPAPAPSRDDAAERRGGAIAWVLAQLADPELPEAKKEKVRDRFRKQWPDVPPPWESNPLPS